MNPFTMILRLTLMQTPFLLVTILFGCKKMDPNPELKDPIYKDLSSIHKELEKTVIELEKNLEENFKELDQAGADGMDLKVARKKITETRQKLRKSIQLRDYTKIRMERRRVEGRRSYRIAFEKGEEWPDPKEFQQYLTHKRLRDAPRVWPTRVTRQNTPIESSKTAEKEEE
ncbi:MAG: hypothetical protein KDD35_01970 [Bdellovibrionales bacterium]|nr:hypothetical protein [Bdellovibrionales bacterium]